MIIQHNIMALNSYNRLSGNNTLVSKNLEKLSSGFKINRAADDAAGLAISEKMRAQITGLTRATQNSQDGISLVQTAEGNLTEVHSMLNRMVDLATQSSNGTYDTENDRVNLQKEVESLKAEINRISDTSHFNGIKLLDGTMGGYSMDKTGANAASFDVDSLVVTGGNLNGADSIVLESDGTDYVFGAGTTLGGIAFTDAASLANFGLKAEVISAPATAGGPGNYSLKISIDDPALVSKAMSDAIGDGVTVSFKQLDTAAATHTLTLTADGAANMPAKNGGLNLQIGDSAEQRVKISVQSMSVKALGLDSVDVSTEKGASDSIKIIKDAINTVSGTRADLGAIQNRLEHTINNLTTTAENMTTSESRIRDTDMAQEMMKFTKNNVLAQAAQSMLAQANQQPQQVLQLLR